MPLKKNISKHLVLINVISSGGQVLLIGLVYFFLYRYLLKMLGVELLGVWSVVLSTSSLANLANFGVADSVIRFVALFKKESDAQKMRQLIFTASVFLSALFVVIAAIIYPFAGIILKYVLPAKYINSGAQILPYSLLCLVLNAVTGVYSSVLDGLQKNYIRSIFFSVSSLVLLFGAYLLVPIWGLKGVALAQVLQSAFTIVSCMLCVAINTRYNPFKWYWSRSIFKQIFSYGMKFQFISLANMLNDPVTKVLLGRFGGLMFVGYYEMANRLIMQVRGVIVSGTQSLIPVIINLSKNVAEVQVFYKKIFSNILFFVTTGIAIIVTGGRLVSFYWIGQYQSVFYFTLILLALSMLLSLVYSPAYFFYMAEGDLNVLIKNHVILGLSNALLGVAGGYLLGGYGVIGGWTIAIIMVTIYMLRHFNKEYALSYRDLFTLRDIMYILVTFTITIVSILQLIKANFKLVDAGLLLLLIIVVGCYFLKFKALDILNLKKTVSN